MCSRKFFGILAAVLLLAPATADAFDGNRKGFLLGFGVGGGALSLTRDLKLADLPDRTFDRKTSFAISTNLKVGWGITDRLLVYYLAEVAWFQHDDMFIYDDPRTEFKEIFWVFEGLGDPPFVAPTKQIWIATGLAGLGVTYYLGKDSPYYVIAAGGMSTWTAPFEDDDWLAPFNDSSQTWFGYSALAGFGWEFMRHWSVEGTAMWGSPRETGSFGLEVTSNTVALLIMVSGMVY
jgi:hypothetical protein